MHYTMFYNILFQSTHLVWGATFSFLSVSCSYSNFNPRTSCEVRRASLLFILFQLIFQSTHLVWGATRFFFVAISSVTISIHAPRVRCDPVSGLWKLNVVNFNPRTSCEVRLNVHRVPHTFYHFNPRTSCEVRLKLIAVYSPRKCISIHAPRVRCDPSIITMLFAIVLFQSTHLVWGATADNTEIRSFTIISIHAPRVRCDYPKKINAYIFMYYFNPRTSCEVRLSQSR